MAPIEFSEMFIEEASPRITLIQKSSDSTKHVSVFFLRSIDEADSYLLVVFCSDEKKSRLDGPEKRLTRGELHPGRSARIPEEGGRDAQ